MKHFVLTRFSLRVPSYAANLGLDDRDRPRWFAYRADILNGGLVPCLLRQTRPVSGLLLLMDEGDRALFDAHIGLHDGLVVPLFTPSKNSAAAVGGILSAVEGPLMVSRVDSDDLVADGYIESVAEALAGAPPGDGPFFCVAASGHFSDLRRIQTRDDQASPFISVLYRRFGGRLDLGGLHRHIAERHPIVTRSADWVQLVHGSNVVNSFRSAPAFPVSDRTWPKGVHKPDPAIFDKANWRSPRLNAFALRAGMRSAWRGLKARLRLIVFSRTG